MTQNTYTRNDGRLMNQLRKISFIPEFVEYPEGSVLVSWGNTRVLCNLTIQPGVPNWLSGQSKGWMTAEYALLPRSTHTRTVRETNGLKGRTQEIRRLIGRSLRMAVDLSQIGERTLLLDCDVIQADGGTRVASVTGGYIALALGLKPLIGSGEIPESALHPPVAAVSVGVIDGQPILDLDYSEDSRAEVDMNIVMNSEGRLIEIQGTAENQPFTKATLYQMLELATTGINEIVSLQNTCIG